MFRENVRELGNLEGIREPVGTNIVEPFLIPEVGNTSGEDSRVVDEEPEGLADLSDLYYVLAVVDAHELRTKEAISAFGQGVTLQDQRFQCNVEKDEQKLE